MADTHISLPECHEGPEAAKRFDSELGFVLNVPRPLIERRERAYRKKVDANPNRRGPKRKSAMVAEQVEQYHENHNTDHPNSA
jgi:hypothetical protein